MTARVLVVDDEPGIRTLLREYLRADGHEVVEAASGAEALACFAEQPVDLVLLDIGLPDMDGLEVLRTLRRTSEVYVIMATARAESPLRRLVTLEEVGALAAFLAGPGGRGMSGQTLFVDAGFHVVR